MSDADKGGLSELLRQQTILARFGELALRSDDLDEILTESCRLVGEALGTQGLRMRFRVDSAQSSLAIQPGA